MFFINLLLILPISFNCWSLIILIWLTAISDFILLLHFAYIIFILEVGKHIFSYSTVTVYKISKKVKLSYQKYTVFCSEGNLGKFVIHLD